MIVLDQNYRSTQTILDAANAVIGNNLFRQEKQLWSALGKGDRIRRYRAGDDRDEAAFVTGEIAALHRDEGIGYGDIAVFYRTNAQSRALETALADRGIAYTVIGGTRFFDRREIRDVLAYLRAVANPGDEVSLRRILNTPRRGIGDTTVGASHRLRRPSAASASPERSARAEEAGASGKALAGIRGFLGLLDELRSADLVDAPARPADRGASSSGPATGTLLEAEIAIGGSRAIEAEGRIENLAELMNIASEHAEPRVVPRVDGARRGHRRPRRRGERVAHDAALGQGPRVPRRVPHRDGGGDLPPLPEPRRARRARGGAAALLRRASPGPASGSTSPTPGAACCSAASSRASRAAS